VLLNEDRFPEKLEQLYEGMDIGDAAETKLKYLRRLPRDPITGKDEWGTRSSKDAPDSLFSDKTNIFDVHSLSDKVALDGTKYRDW
jgi:general secretion pathway protein G